MHNNYFIGYKAINWLTFILLWTDDRTYGVPTIRTDLRAPDIKRADDSKNYGDQSDAYGPINPSSFSRCKVHKKYFFLPMNLEQVYTNVAHYRIYITRFSLAAFICDFYDWIWQQSDFWMVILWTDSV